MKTLKRREFIKTVGAGSLGLAVLNNLGIPLYANPLQDGQSFMGGITEFSILNDIAQLAVAGKQVTFKTAELISADINNPIAANLSRMGATVMADESQVEGLLEKVKTELKEVDNAITADIAAQKDSKSDLMKKKLVIQKKLSLLLGWYMAAGIRKYVSPMKSEPGNLLSERSIYQDMYVLKQVAGTTESVSAKEMASLFHGMQPRAICRTHTITPDYDDGRGWAIRIMDWRNNSRILMTKYAEAFVNTDKQKTAEYISKPNFYNPDDTIIQIARWAQDAKPLKSIDSLLMITDAQSTYAKALITGINSLKTADQMLVG